jgi:hypothetical protein
VTVDVDSHGELIAFARAKVHFLKLRRELYDGFVPDFRVTKLLRKGSFRWWKAERTNLRLMLVSPKTTPAEESSAVTPARA